MVRCSSGRKIFLVLRHIIYLNDNMVSDFYEELLDDDDVLTAKRTFNKVYNELVNQEEIVQINSELSEMSEIPLREIIEVSGTLTVLKSFLDQVLLNEIMNSNLLGFADALQFADHKEINTVERQGRQIQNLAKKDSPIPIVIPKNKTSNPFKILSSLERNHTLLEVDNLNQREVFVLGKIIKKVEKSKKYKLYLMLPTITLNRE